MADRFEQPGVFTQEINNSFVEPSFEFPGACFIGLTEKGPAFEPINVNTWTEYNQKFGEENSNYFLPYAVKNYLKYNSPANIIRVLGKSTYTLTVGESAGTNYALIGSNSISDNTGSIKGYKLYGEIYSRLAIEIPTIEGATATTSDAFDIYYTSSAGVGVTASGLTTDPNSNNYFGKAINSIVSSSNSFYVHGGYDWNYRSGEALFLIASKSGSSEIPGQYEDSSDGTNLTKYSNGQTPWITSQNFGTSSAITQFHDLFKIHNLSDGNNSNNDIKISIANILASPNITASSYGTFDLYVRQFGDSDANPIIIEQHPNMSIDPSSQNYIGKVIGNYKRQWDSNDQHFNELGTYPLKSKYIRVEMASDIQTVPINAVPYGFRAIPTPMVPVLSASVSRNIKTEPLPTNSISTTRDYFGIDFTRPINDALKVSIRHDIGSGSDSTLSRYYTVYDLGAEVSCSVDGNVLKGSGGGHLTSSDLAKWRKFTVPMYKGWDAINHSQTINYGNFGSVQSNLEEGFIQAVNIVGNPEEVDVSDVFMPGVGDSTVVDRLITKVEERGDIFAILDIGQLNDTLPTVEANSDPYKSSYAATFFPWLQIYDANNDQYVYAPPSIGVASAIAYGDSISDVWNAPAGNKRGNLTKISNVIDTYINLNADDRAELYGRNINPIANFKDSGIIIWGQKTLQRTKSKLDRINTRRLMIKIKKFVRFVALSMIFEQAGPEFWNEFVNKVEPFLEDIKNRKGLYEYNVVMDDSNNNFDTEANRTVVGVIHVNPQVAGEFLQLQFTISASGVEFLS